MHQTKEPQHKDDFDEWLARIVCFAFSVPPQWAVKQMNRATPDGQSAQSEEEGLEPTKEWVKDLVDEIIAEEFASPDLELHWLDEDDGDPETVLADRLKLGAFTLNEMRDHLGLDPYANPPADRARVRVGAAQSEEEGLEPTKEWVKDLVDEIIAEEFASPDLELHWLDEDDGDPETVLADRLKLGAFTLNELRGHLGLDPYANPAADRAMVLTPTGYVPIEANVDVGEDANESKFNWPSIVPCPEV